MKPETAEQLVGNHRKFLAFLERRVGDRALAEDILQDAFVRSMEKGGDIRDESSAVAWFYRMLRNSVIDHHRRAGTRNRALEAFALEMKDAATPPPNVTAEICGCVGELASTLKPEYAQAIKRVDLEEVAVKDFAAESGITPTNAGVRLSRAREALRKQVKASCGTCAEHGCVECRCKKTGGGASAM